MFKRIADLRTEDNIENNILLRGWIHRLRKQKEKTFIILRDDRGDIIQAVCPSNLCEDLTIESSIQIQGKLEKDPRAVEGGYEVKVDNIMVFNIANVDYPIGEYQSNEILLDFRHLSLRTRKMINIGKLRNSLLKHSREWFDKDDWMEVTPPILVQSSVEGGSTLFEVKYFNEKAFLSQSSQLYLESMIYCLGPVWTISPSFRAEKSRTIRHLAEFTHLEAEAPWIDMNDLITTQEKLIFSIITQIREHNKKELKFLNAAAIKKLDEISIPFEKITYDKAIDILRSVECRIRDDDGKERLIEWGDDLSLESERELTKDRSTSDICNELPFEHKALLR